MASAMLLKRGAEAELRRAKWHGREVVEKHRVPKSYRSPQLDESLRKSRLRMEVRLMSEAREIGMAVPLIYDIDVEENRLVLEFIEGPTVKEVLQKRLFDPPTICRQVGEIAAKLHSGGIVHGDLTTSNMIYRDGRILLIDFSLGEKNSSTEAKGVDLHLLKEALTSAHSDMPELFDHVAGGYRNAYKAADEVLLKVKEIESRGRYT
jgi:TP53 regulating kinase-like protein